MLKAPADFPYPGSEALLGDRRVKIIRIEPDGRRLVQGIGRPLLTRTVELGTLSDGSLPDQPMDRWYAERVIRIDPDAAVASDGHSKTLPTPTTDLYADFVIFSRARTVADNLMPTRHAFSHFLALKGLASTVRKVGRHAERCVDLQLLPMQVAA